MNLDFWPFWLFWWHNNLWRWRKREISSGIFACRSVKVLDPCLHFRAAKNEHATLTIYRSSSTCWHLKTTALAQIQSSLGQRNQRQIAFSISWTFQEPRALISWKLCDFGCSENRFEFHFVSASLLSKWGQRKISKSFTCTAMAASHACQWSI